MSALDMTEADVKLLLAANCHIGAKNSSVDMTRYIWKRKVDGVYLINLGKLWQKLMLAARIIVAVENPQDIVVVASRQFGQRAVFKFAQHTGCSYIAGRYTPGTFTNQVNRDFKEPRLLLVTDPSTDHQPIREASYVNIPVIAFCDTDANLNFVDLAIPTNNKGRNAIALVYWLLAREVNRMRGVISREEPWDIMVDLFMFRNPEEAEAQQKAAERLEAKEADEAGLGDYQQPVASYDATADLATDVAPVAAAAPGAQGGDGNWNVAPARPNWQGGAGQGGFEKSNFIWDD